MTISIDIVRVIQQTGVELKKNGQTYHGLCPLHLDAKTPSLVVYPATNTFHCFGNCITNGGNAIEFLKHRYRFNYLEAQNWLDENLGRFNVKKDVIKFKEPERPKVVPHHFITYWHNLLDVENKRQYYHSRGFTNETINREMWGWDGERYTIPVWDGEPQYSTCLGARRRKPDDKEGPKYIGLSGMNQPTIWGRWFCKNKEIVLGFVGEFDAALAVQDGFPSFSFVNGINAISAFPQDWPTLWFPNTKKIILIFDKKEEPNAGQSAAIWNKYKGFGSSFIFHWLSDKKDYCEFRQANSKKDFLEMMTKQFEGVTNNLIFQL